MPQMRKVRKIDRRVPRARQLRRSMTDAERKLWWNLRALLAKEFHFRRQPTIGPYFVDFACHQAFLNSRGYPVLRFWYIECLQPTHPLLPPIPSSLFNDP